MLKSLQGVFRLVCVSDWKELELLSKLKSHPVLPGQSHLALRGQDMILHLV